MLQRRHRDGGYGSRSFSFFGRTQGPDEDEHIPTYGVKSTYIQYLRGRFYLLVFSRPFRVFLGIRAASMHPIPLFWLSITLTLRANIGVFIFRTSDKGKPVWWACNVGGTIQIDWEMV